MGLKTVIKVCRQEEKNKFGSLELILLIKITFHVNIKFLILVFRLLTGLSTIFLHLSTGLSTVGVRRSEDPPLTPPKGGEYNHLLVQTTDCYRRPSPNNRNSYSVPPQGRGIISCRVRTYVSALFVIVTVPVIAVGAGFARPTYTIRT